MSTSKYIRELRIKAGWKSWDDVFRSQRQAQDEKGYLELLERRYGKEYREDYERRKQHDLEKRIKRQSRDKLLAEALSTLSPRNEWVGAAWVSPEGHLYPVRYGNHTSRAEQLVPHLFHDEWTREVERDGWCDCGYLLSQRHGWLRIGADGLVGDHNWNRVREIPERQFAAIWDMWERGERLGTHDYRETGGFLTGLKLSVRYAMGEVNEQGETPEEEAARRKREHEYYAELRRRDEEWERQYQARYAVSRY
jgi:hypothetical protein